MYNATGEPPLEMNGTADAASSFELPLSLDAALPYLNPWNLSVAHWLVGFVLIRGAIAFYDNLVEFLIRFSKVPKLPTREDAATGEPKEVYFKGLDRISFVYLVINAADEWIFVQNLTHFIWHSDAVPKTLGGLNPLNTAAALYLMFLVLDFFYAPAHRFLHWGPVYPYIHKHHHRQRFPVRGYLDAGNEHPVEHVIGVSCTWMAVWTAVAVTGAHAATIFFFFNIHAALAMLNHSEFDVDVTVLGLNYSVKAHEMHHRFYNTNYAQYWLGMDKLMGTFDPYTADNTRPSRGLAKARAAAAARATESGKKVQ
jgi:sterol desaturase/sphingolipid hydroxylase (fatty acid hydroxylase superfamily)